MVTVKINVPPIKEVAIELARKFDETAILRDKQGGTAFIEREMIRESGLLTILIPKQYGGMGGTWADVLKVVEIFAKVDSSLAHIFGYHYLNLITPHLCGNEEQKERYYKETATKNLFWGNAFNPYDKRLIVEKSNNEYVLNGEKSFCSGSVDSDYLLISAAQSDQEEPFIAVIPTNRIGVIVKNDWDNFGQRQTDSGTVRFENVVVEESEILQNGFNRNEFSKLRINISSYILNHVFLGITEGAFEKAREYTQTEARTRLPLYTTATEDPTILRHYGEFIVQIEAARLLVDQSDKLLTELWEKGETILQSEREQLEHSAKVAKVFTTKTGLDITSRIFEAMGSRATASKYGFDRYWRNIRTMTLHVPIDITIQELGKEVFQQKER